VRYQVAFTLGEWDDERCAEALVELARGPDENIRNAALSSARSAADPRSATRLASIRGLWRA
jgi:HEAT repeat protein